MPQNSWRNPHLDTACAAARARRGERRPARRALSPSHTPHTLRPPSRPRALHSPRPRACARPARSAAHARRPRPTTTGRRVFSGHRLPACARALSAPLFFSARAQMCTRKRQREHALRYTAAREPTALPLRIRARDCVGGRERRVAAGLPPRGRASLGGADRRRRRRRAAFVRGRCRSEAAAATASGARPQMGRAGTRAGAASPRGAARRRHSGPAWHMPS